MSFEKLIAKVAQAELALEAQERQVAADLRQLKNSWRAAWTPGRIVTVGLVTGFLTGRAEPLRNAARSGGIVRIVSLLTTLLAGGSAHIAVEEAEDAADDTEGSAAAVDPAAAARAPAPAGQASPIERHEP